MFVLNCDGIESVNFVVLLGGGSEEKGVLSGHYGNKWSQVTPSKLVSVFREYGAPCCLVHRHCFQFGSYNPCNFIQR